jgi:hypothetical protein
MKQLYFLVCLGGVGQAAYGQGQVTGKVLDKQTHQPVPYASVAVLGSQAGTTSNAEGEFVLTVKSLPAKVVVSQLSYGRDTVAVAAAGALRPIELVSAAVSLPDVDMGSYSAELLKKAYRQVQRTRGQFDYGQAFYRQITRNGSEPIEVLEAVWDVKISSAGLDGTRLAQGRYASRPGLMNFSNFSLYTKVFGGFSGVAASDTAASHAVVSLAAERLYILKFKGLTQGEGRQIAEIEFATRPGIPAVSGSVFIDIATYQVVHARAIRALEMHSNKKSYVFKNGVVSLEVDFKSQASGALPNYVKVSSSLVVSQPRKPDVPVQVESLAFFYDSKPVPTGLPYVGPNAPLSDLAAIKQKLYDPTFWRDNPVVKRTPMEEEVIRSFEQEKAFGTMLAK